VRLLRVSVSAKSGRRLSADIIGLSSTLWRNRPLKLSNSVK